MLFPLVVLGTLALVGIVGCAVYRHSYDDEG